VILSEIKFVIPQNIKLNQIKLDKNLKIFDEEVLQFLESLSKELLKQKEYNELVALGFWLRKSNINKIKNSFLQKYKDYFLLPRGIVFHIAPSNVDTIFVYSFVLSMLVGNINILRIGQKVSEQILTLIQIIKRTLEKYENLKSTLYIVRYGYEENITSYFSSLCDVRVIWGGDHTINTIRKIPIKSTALELTFADKFSFALLNLENIELNDIFFERLYRDSFTFFQQACSSIKAICFLPTSKDKKIEFWDKFENFIKTKNPTLTPKEGITRFNTSVSISIENNIKVHKTKYLYILKIDSLKNLNREKHCGLGLFYDIDIDSIEELLRFSSKKEQTLAIEGISKKDLIKAIQNTTPNGFDRYVKLGNSMNFGEIWDGIDFLISFSRIIDVDI